MIRAYHSLIAIGIMRIKRQPDPYAPTMLHTKKKSSQRNEDISNAEQL